MHRLAAAAAAALLLCCSAASSANVDPTTPASERRIAAPTDGSAMHLVFSDEFGEDGRSFAQGRDGNWVAEHRPDETNGALQFYNASHSTTRGGSLRLTLERKDAKYWGRPVGASGKTEGRFAVPREMTRPYTSGMVTSWNQVCFTGGVVEIKVRLPGSARDGGVWPAAWLMGNLAKVGAPASTDGVWPWSYDVCDKDSIRGQKISACDASRKVQGPRKDGLRPGQGRGAPEIDIFEVLPAYDGTKPANASTSLQISPGVQSHRPKAMRRLNTSAAWYDGIYTGDRTELNAFYYGQLTTPGVFPAYWADALSAETVISDAEWSEDMVWRCEWEPGPSGYVKWYLNGVLVFGVDGPSIQERTGGHIPSEPMYLILNLALSPNWGMPSGCETYAGVEGGCKACGVCYTCDDAFCQCALPPAMRDCKSLPTELSVDYVRVYQRADGARQEEGNPNAHSFGCSPPTHPTAGYIYLHKDLYKAWVEEPIGQMKAYRFLNFLAGALAVVSVPWLLWSGRARRVLSAIEGKAFGEMPATRPSMMALALKGEQKPLLRTMSGAVRETW